MSDRHTIPLTRSNLDKALQGVRAATLKGGYTLELREAKRTDDQNRALWSLLSQVQRARPTHQGVKMTPTLWKAVFLQALGTEMVFVPTLDGCGMFPMGQRSSALTKAEFADLLTLILSWCAREGIEVDHFDEPSTTTQGPARGQPASAGVAA